MSPSLTKCRGALLLLLLAAPNEGFTVVRGPSRVHSSSRSSSARLFARKSRSGSSTSSATLRKRSFSTARASSRNATASTSYYDLDDFLVQDIQRSYRDVYNQQQQEQVVLSMPPDIQKVVKLQDSSSAGAIAAVAATPTSQSTSKDNDAAVNRARLLLLVAAALYGTNFSCVKLLGEADIPVGASSTLRFGLAALATLPWLLPPKEEVFGKDGVSLSSPSVAAAMAGLEVGLWNSIGYVAQAVGLETTAASKSAFLCSLAVVVVPLLDMLAGKLLLPRQMVGTLMALGGVAILELGGDIHDLSLTSGDIASLLQPLAFGMGFWRMEQAMHKYPNQAMRSTAAQLLAVFGASALYSGITEPGSLNLEQVQHWVSDPMILTGLVWTGVITTALTVYMETVALETLSAAETTLIFSTEPLFGAATAAAVMGEQLGMDSAVGAVLIVAGCIFSNLGMDGIFSFFSQGGSNPLGGASVAAAHSGSPSTTRNTLVLARSGIAAAIDSSTSTVWNNLSVGAKVIALEAQNFVEDATEWLLDY